MAKSFVAIIPARGGSKGIPRKNLTLLAGRPLIEHSIVAALNCPAVQRCIVTTDDSEIRSVAIRAGADVVNRPAALATAMSPIEETVRHAVQERQLESEMKQSSIVLLQPTSPLRNATHVSKAIELFLRSPSAKALFSVTSAENHPYKMFLREKKYLSPLFGKKHLSRNRQELPSIFRQNGAIYIVRLANFLAQNSFYVPPVIPFLMSAEDSVDIDSLLDLKLCEVLLQDRDSDGKKAA